MKCLWGHSECRNAQQLDWFPKRLLYFENTGGALPAIRVIHTEDHLPSGPYIALSHCWGGVQPVRSLTTNIAAFQQRIEFDHLSAVLQDAVTTARKFGVSYIWIDSLCIIQDDNADWAAHAQQMDRIYENAILVIAAVSSENGMVPFLGPEAPNDRHLRTSKSFDLSDFPGLHGSIRTRNYASARSDLTWFQGPLTGRAWAWQEHVLATRIIHFTQAQCIWECLQSRGSEMMGSLEPRADSMKSKLTRPENNESVSDVWLGMIHDYGGRSLTYKKDKLPALSGVAARFQLLFNTPYYAGLWKSRMVLDLAWENQDKLSFVSIPQPSLGGFLPSWSWASIQGPVIYGLDYHFHAGTIKYSVTDVDCEPSTDNPFGEVRQGASIEIEGMWVSAQLMIDERGFAVVLREGFAPQRVTPDCRLVQNTLDIDGSELKTFRRALPTDDSVPIEDDPIVVHQLLSGTVFCFLLMSLEHNTLQTELASVLILAPIGPAITDLQRLALGRGGPDKQDNSSIPWRWADYERWEDWEDWFAGADQSRFKVF